MNSIDHEIIKVRQRDGKRDLYIVYKNNVLLIKHEITKATFNKYPNISLYINGRLESLNPYDTIKKSDKIIMSINKNKNNIFTEMKGKITYVI